MSLHPPPEGDININSSPSFKDDEYLACLPLMTNRQFLNSFLSWPVALAKRPHASDTEEAYASISLKPVFNLIEPKSLMVTTLNTSVSYGFMNVVCSILHSLLFENLCKSLHSWPSPKVQAS